MGGLRGRICLYPQIHGENQAEPVSRLGIKPSHARLPIPNAGGPTARLESVHMLNSDARYVCSAGVCSFLGGRGANGKGCVRAGSFH